MLALPSPQSTQQNLDTLAKDAVEEMIDAMKRNRAKPTDPPDAIPPIVMKKPVKKATAKPKKKPKATGSNKGRSIHVEASVNHVLARTGLDTFPKSKSFPYKTPAGIPAAKKLAEKWLTKMGV